MVCWAKAQRTQVKSVIQPRTGWQTQLHSTIREGIMMSLISNNKRQCTVA